MTPLIWTSFFEQLAKEATDKTAAQRYMKALERGEITLPELNEGIDRATGYSTLPHALSRHGENTYKIFPTAEDELLPRADLTDPLILEDVQAASHPSKRPQRYSRGRESTPAEMGAYTRRALRAQLDPPVPDQSLPSRLHGLTAPLYDWQPPKRTHAEAVQQLKTDVLERIARAKAEAAREARAAATAAAPAERGFLNFLSRHPVATVAGTAAIPIAAGAGIGLYLAHRNKRNKEQQQEATGAGTKTAETFTLSQFSGPTGGSGNAFKQESGHAPYIPGRPQVKPGSRGYRSDLPYPGSSMPMMKGAAPGYGTNITTVSSPRSMLARTRRVGQATQTPGPGPSIWKQVSTHHSRIAGGEPIPGATKQ